MKDTGATTGIAASSLQTRAAIRARSAPLADLDTQLMLQVREGSAEAANALVRRNFERVARYISRVVRHPRCVEDLTQDVFVYVLKSAPRYEPTAKFSTWLYRIATNAARNYLNQACVRKQRAPDGETPALEPVDRSESGPEHRLTLSELRDRVSAAISSLPLNQRIALTLFQYEDLSYEQIAAVLDTTIEAVRCLLKRAREALREQLAGLI